MSGGVEPSQIAAHCTMGSVSTTRRPTERGVRLPGRIAMNDIDGVNRVKRRARRILPVVLVLAFLAWVLFIVVLIAAGTA